MITLPLDVEFDVCSRYVNSHSALALLQSTAKIQTCIQHSSKPRSDVGRRKKLKLGTAALHRFLKIKHTCRPLEGTVWPRLQCVLFCRGRWLLFKPLSAVCRASVIPSAPSEKYLFPRAPAPRVCGRSEPVCSLGEKATRPSHWVGKIKRYGPTTIEYTRLLKLSEFTPPLYRRNI